MRSSPSTRSSTSHGTSSRRSLRGSRRGSVRTASSSGTSQRGTKRTDRTAGSTTSRCSGAHSTLIRRKRALKRAFIASVDGRPMGFVETYRADDHPRYFANLGISDPRAITVDVFIGERTMLGRGLGSELIRRFFESILADEDFSVCYAPPD